MKRVVIETKGEDGGICCARALVTSKAKADHHPQWRSFLRGYTFQHNQTIALHTTTRYHSVLAGLVSLRDYHLIVVDADHSYACFKYGTGPTPLALLYLDGHYDAIISLPRFFGRSYFCGTCLKRVNNLKRHHCSENANLCRKSVSRKGARTTRRVSTDAMNSNCPP